MAASFHAFQTALGSAAIAWTEQGVCGFVLPDGDPALAAARIRRRFPAALAGELPNPIRACVAKVRRYASGEVVDFAETTLDLSPVEPFARAIYEAARRVGFGQTTTYGALAASAGHPGLARETGQALGRNPVPLLVPCHRILAAGNRIGGFSAPGGAATKRRLLEREGVGLGPAPSPQMSLGF